MAKDFYREMALAGARRQYDRRVRRVYSSTAVPRFLRRLRNARYTSAIGLGPTRMQHRMAIHRVAAVQRRVRRNVAATRIQSVARRWLVRRAPIRNAAATRIQALFRGYRARKALQ